MKYYIICKRDETGRNKYYSHSRPFASTFEPNFTYNEVNAKFFTDKNYAKEILQKIKDVGLKGYKVIEF